MKRAFLYAAVAALLFVAAGIGYSAAPAPVTALKTTGITIVDSAGKTRATLGMEGDTPALSLLDASGKPHLRLAVSNSASTIAMNDSDGKLKFGLTGNFNGTTITMYDANANAVFLKTESGVLKLIEPKTGSVLWSSKPLQ